MPFHSIVCLLSLIVRIRTVKTAECIVAEGSSAASGREPGGRPPPVPGQQLIEALDIVLIDPREHVGKPSLRIDVVEPCCLDQCVHHGRSFAAAIRAGEQPRLAAERDAAQCPLGGIVGKADAAVVEKARERVPALEHVVHRLAHITVTGELASLRLHPNLEIGDKRRDAKALIAHILNLFAYNEMKNRAGVVGRGLAEHLLNPLVAAGKRVHLVGHSFGGRLVTAATDTVKGKISNLTVLEGAFSHNALSIDPDGPINGAFKSVVDNAKVAGRIVTAHSDHDVALWIFYPLASRRFRDSYTLQLAGPLGAVFGGPTDRYGAIGANGPQNLTGVNHLIFTGTSLPELKSGVNVPDCTSFVACHSDVWKQGSAYIVAAGLLSD
jgi:hypothetical protein